MGRSFTAVTQGPSTHTHTHTLLTPFTHSKMQIFSLAEERLQQSVALPPRCAGLRVLKTDVGGSRSVCQTASVVLVVFAYLFACRRAVLFAFVVFRCVLFCCPSCTGSHPSSILILPQPTDRRWLRRRHRSVLGRTRRERPPAVRGAVALNNVAGPGGGRRPSSQHLPAVLLAQERGGACLGPQRPSEGRPQA